MVLMIVVLLVIVMPGQARAGPAPGSEAAPELGRFSRNYTDYLKCCPNP